MPWFILFVALVGNCGFWLFWFNRVNATGIRRPITKAIEKLIVFVCFLIPALIFAIEGSAIAIWLSLIDGSLSLPDAPIATYYGGFCVISFFVLGALWVESRRSLKPPKQLISETTELHDVHAEVGTPANKATSWLIQVPGNQIGQLSVTRKEFALPRAIPELEGFRIAHISDIHLTGQYQFKHHEFVLDRLMELEADTILISGDLIDHDHCLSQLDQLIETMHAKYGVYFVFGNHDLRLKDMIMLSRRITDKGAIDLGLENRSFAVGDAIVTLFGNERPWLERRSAEQIAAQQEAAAPNENHFRIGVSHTPDQFNWARRCHCDLLFAGHTHGGQMRLPVLGSLLSPSLYGSRYSSGVFHRLPTLMHVSRGVAGTYPLRWFCPPEISLKTTRAHSVTCL